jgi:hypothetical protein
MTDVPNSSSAEQEVNINIDINAIASALLADPGFIDAVTRKVRTELTKDARGVGNLFGIWAQQPKR